MCYLVIHYKNNSYSYMPFETREKAEAAKEKVINRPNVITAEIAEQMRIYI